MQKLSMVLLLLFSCFVYIFTPSASIEAKECPCELDSLVDSELSKTSNYIPPPDEGFSIAISGDFNAMMGQKPILDPEKASFHEGNAFFWHETMAKLFIVNLSETSKEFKHLIGALDALNRIDTDTPPIEKMRQLKDRFKNFKSENRHDKFCRSFIEAHLRDLIQISEIYIKVNEICQRLSKNPPYKEIQSSLTKTSYYVNKTKGIIFSLSPTPSNPLRTKAVWKALRRLSIQIKNCI
ncbi:MAG: hypothetical protein GXO84_07590 [Chlorobi bacterium]|nr:hypothetical protein [Chlorobiota bacterium]